MKSTHKLLSSLVLAGSVLGLTSGAAQAVTLSWQTTPVLGYATYLESDFGYTGHTDVIVTTDTGLVRIPHNALGDAYAGPGSSMTLFHVGQTVDAGSGIYYGVEGNSYRVDETYVGQTRTVSYTPYTLSLIHI